MALSRLHLVGDARSQRGALRISGSYRAQPLALPLPERVSCLQATIPIGQQPDRCKKGGRFCPPSQVRHRVSLLCGIRLEPRAPPPFPEAPTPASPPSMAAIAWRAPQRRSAGSELSPSRARPPQPLCGVGPRARKPRVAQAGLAFGER